MSRGAKPGQRFGGRAKGTRNHASIAREREVKESGATPLDVMIEDMRWHHSLALTEQAKGAKADKKLVTQELAAARDAAKDAAPYVHPKLATLRTDMNLTGTLTLDLLVRAALALNNDAGAALLDITPNEEGGGEETE